MDDCVRSLRTFVDDDVGDALQQRVVLEPPEEHTRGDERQAGAVRHL